MAKNFAALFLEYTAACADFGRLSEVNETTGKDAESLEMQRKYVEKLAAEIIGMIPPELTNVDAPASEKNAA